MPESDRLSGISLAPPPPDLTGQRNTLAPPHGPRPYFESTRRDALQPGASSTRFVSGPGPVLIDCWMGTVPEAMTRWP
jgi:hypothetical protein